MTAAEGVMKHSAAEDCSMDQPRVGTTRTGKIVLVFCDRSVTASWGRLANNIKFGQPRLGVSTSGGLLLVRTMPCSLARKLLQNPQDSSRFRPQHAPSDRFLTRSCWALQSLGSPSRRGLFDATSARNGRATLRVEPTI